MKARLAQLRLRGVRQRAGERALAAIGVVSAPAGLVLLFTESGWAKGGVVAVGLAAALVSGYGTLPRPEVHLVHRGTGAGMWFVTGDLFAVTGEPVAITVNTHFDVAVGSVTARSLIRQLVERWYDGDDAPVRSELGIDPAEPGRVEPSPVGTIEEIVDGERHALLIAVSQRNRDTTSSVVINDVWVALQVLWGHARRLGCARISVPVIGSGMSNARVDQPTLLMLLMASYAAAAHESKDTCPVRVVLHGTPDDTLALVELAVDFGRALGFEQVD